MEFFSSDDILSQEFIIKNPKMGYSFMAQPKIYFGKKAPEYGFMGLNYRSRNFFLQDYNIVYNDITINFGWHLFLGKSNNLLMSYETGIGPRFMKNKTLNENGIFFATPVNFKLGYIF